ncbi:MAG: pentapeptide repeat-containing protein [Cyanobacteria bacterium P01_D01_bin.128]
MAKNRLWKFLTKAVNELVSFEAVEGSKDTVEAVLGLAGALEESGTQIQRLAPLVNQFDSLLDVLNSPLAKVLEAGLPFVSIGTGLLKFYLNVTKEEPTVAQSVALVSQAAYLETVKAFLAQPKLKGWLATVGDRPSSASVRQKLKALGDLELSDTEARRALLYFHESKLAEAYGEVLSARLVELRFRPDDAVKIADNIARATQKRMLSALANSSDSVKALVEWYCVGGDAVFEKYLSIDTYLAEIIASGPHEQVFAESFEFKDIYVPLKAQLLTAAGEIDQAQEPKILEQWVRQMLREDSKKGQVLFVQGGPGRGKSVFCRMFADWVRCREHPRWTPILIRLRDVAVLSRDFEETLAKAVDRDFAKTDSGWLTDRNVNFLFFLDGFDELLMEGRTSGGLDHFLDQVGRFQEQCARNSEKGHRVLITGRTLALQAIESRMPGNLLRVEISPMDDELQNQWFERWGNLIGHDATHLMEILQDHRLPGQVRELAREPLLLYLLAAMHRDRELHLEMFEGAEGAKAKVLIYERTLDWVLTKQRPVWLNHHLTALEIESLRRILQEAGLCVVQSGMEFANISAIEDRLSQNGAAKAFLEGAQKQLETNDTPLRNALAAFYLQEGQQREGSIEFVHKSFGEFLCAERIVNSLIDICQSGRNREYDIEDPAFFWIMYDLLGCHVLTPEIVEYLTALLIKHPELEAERLYKRLYGFYWRWSEGEFIDAPPENLPQRKMRLLQRQAPDREEKLGQRQVDVYTGFNAMILLFELHRHGSTLVTSQPKANENATLPQHPFLFHPCKPLGSENFDKSRLLRIIGVSHCIGIEAFIGSIGPFLGRTHLYGTYLRSTYLRSANLRGADLISADLISADLISANLRSANLRRTDLRSAYLRSANLRSANLRGADLRRTDLISADLRRADLRSTNLSSAVLSSADLRNANLREADLTGAILSDEYGEIRWDEYTNWQDIKGIERAIGVPEALKQQLGLTPPEPPEAQA